MLALERQGLVSQAASGAPSENDIRYEITAEGNFMLADKQENLANLRFLVDYRIARYYQRLRSERNSEHKKIFWAGIGWH